MDDIVIVIGCILIATVVIVNSIKESHNALARLFMEQQVAQMHMLSMIGAMIAQSLDQTSADEKGES